MTVPIPAVEELVQQIRLAGQLAALSIRVDRDLADGIGLKNVAILDVSTGEFGQVVRLWDEGLGDFWIEFAGATATWWRQGRKEATLAEVVVALLEGRFTVEGEVLTVSPRDRTTLVLSSRM